jgi:hypothetical protein
MTHEKESIHTEKPKTPTRSREELAFLKRVAQRSVLWVPAEIGVGYLSLVIRDYTSRAPANVDPLFIPVAGAVGGIATSVAVELINRHYAKKSKNLWQK